MCGSPMKIGEAVDSIALYTDGLEWLAVQRAVDDVLRDGWVVRCFPLEIDVAFVALCFDHFRNGWRLLIRLRRIFNAYVIDVERVSGAVGRALSQNDALEMARLKRVQRTARESCQRNSDPCPFAGLQVVGE